MIWAWRFEWYLIRWIANISNGNRGRHNDGLTITSFKEMRLYNTSNGLWYNIGSGCVKIEKICGSNPGQPSQVNYRKQNLSASYQPWQASAGPPKVWIGSFLVMALGAGVTLGHLAKNALATRRWLAAGSTASWPFGKHSPITFFEYPLPSTW